MESFCRARPGIKLCGVTRYKWAGLTDLLTSDECDRDAWHVMTSYDGPTELCTCDGRNEICFVSDMLWSNKWHQQLMQLTFCCLPNCNSRDLLKLLRETCLGWRRLHEKIFRAMALITHWQIAVSETQRGPFKSQSVSISERAVSRHKLFYNDLFCRL